MLLEVVGLISPSFLLTPKARGMSIGTENEVPRTLHFEGGPVDRTEYATIIILQGVRGISQ